MKFLPIDCSNMTLHFLEAVAKERDGRQVENSDRELVWSVRVLANQVGEKPETIEVAIPGRVEPKAPMFAEVTLPGLAARPWAMDGRSGISFFAREVVVKAAVNGSKAPAAPAAAAS